MKQIGIGILGGSGYGAGELLRILHAHPEAEIVSVSSGSAVGKPIDSVHSHLANVTDLSFQKTLDMKRLLTYRDPCIVASLPHGESSKAIQELLRAGLDERVRIVDLSGDLRLRNEARHGEFYPDVAFAAELRNRFVYGLPEKFKEQIRRARYIANPGCLATAATIALLPFCDLDIVGSIALDAKTGTSGAGKQPQESMHHPGRHGNFEAYKMLTHRHEAEILQSLDDPEGHRIRTMFVPHLLPVARGIFLTAYLTLRAPRTVKELTDRCRAFFTDAPFIRIREGSPELHDVVGTNYCDIGLVSRGEQLIVMTALDNLVKGMAGQAVQNINLMCGLKETAGLSAPGLGIL